MRLNLTNIIKDNSKRKKVEYVIMIRFWVTIESISASFKNYNLICVNGLNLGPVRSQLLLPRGDVRRLWTHCERIVNAHKANFQRSMETMPFI